ncbi:polysaccharide deacetylase family protein [Pseudorhodoferax sp.]|uniref:polysaccharide deacetylase family protein n=1 Tax=Pseudorhodoferax sp. TaxID=1993553 RepID=UPI002DD68C62|nr:polysaccharide deacetylase family protein [Pseudorhodoferax sp.]
MLKLVHSLMSPGGVRGRLSILIFHRVLAEPDAMLAGEVDRRRFETICGWLADWAHVLPLDEAVQRWRTRSLPRRALAITFDDGYADNHDVALPVLRRFGLTATFFIATGFLNGGRMWNDVVIEALRGAPDGTLDLGDIVPGMAPVVLQGAADRRSTAFAVLRAIKYLEPAQRLAAARAIEARCGGPSSTRLMMGDAQVRALRQAGMQIGAHTVNHPILRVLPREQARREIGDSKAYLADLLREPIGLFAYPNGKPDTDYGADAVQLVRELGFDAAVSTAWGAARADSSAWELPRFSPWDHREGRYHLRLIDNFRRTPPLALA